MEQIYGLSVPPDEKCWSPYLLAEVLAIKRGYLLAKGGRPDAHRAGREILIDVMDARIMISWPPPLESTEKVLTTDNNQQQQGDLVDEAENGGEEANKADEEEEEEEEEEDPEKAARRAEKKERKAAERKAKRYVSPVFIRF